MLFKCITHSKLAKKDFKSQYLIRHEGSARKRLALAYCYLGRFKSALRQSVCISIFQFLLKKM